MQLHPTRDIPVAKPAATVMLVRDGELGTWLCRTMFDRFTGESDSFSTCGNATRALPFDDCGCC